MSNKNMGAKILGGAIAITGLYMIYTYGKKKGWFGSEKQMQEEKKVAASLKGGVFNCNGVEMDLSKFKNAPKFIEISEQKPDKPKEPETALNIDAQLKLLNIKKNKYKYQGGNGK